MPKIISAADANRRFLELLRTVRNGQTVIVTSHGKPVAQISAVPDNGTTNDLAYSALLARLRKQRSTTIGRWSREDLYDDVE